MLPALGSHLDPNALFLTLGAAESSPVASPRPRVSQEQVQGYLIFDSEVTMMLMA